MALKHFKTKGSPELSPKPVHPTAARLHGFFGVDFVRHHMMADDRWSPSSLTEEYKGMAGLLERCCTFKKQETKANHINCVRTNRILRNNCRDGRLKLQMVRTGKTRSLVRTLLINRKDLQRLYQKMPVHMIVDNINQRTFVLRKESDRLQFRLQQLKDIYLGKLREKVMLDNRIKAESSFSLEEEQKSNEFRKCVDNSNIRLRSFKTINSAYKKLIQVLQHDGIFYEPILRSLSKDMEDQMQFIKHILHLTKPALRNFKALTEEFRLMGDRARKNVLAKNQFLQQYRRTEKRHSNIATGSHSQRHDDDQVPEKLTRYVRETRSMMFLKNELEAVESIIKQVEYTTLCSRVREIYPRIKNQIDNNTNLRKMIEMDILSHNTLNIKMKHAQVLQGVLINNLSEEEINRMTRISELKAYIKVEDEFEEKTIAYIKNRADTYVLLRSTLWNLNDILRHVGKDIKVTRTSYPVSYLRLPLLKFEMYAMHACAPEITEEDLETMIRRLIRKVALIMKAFKTDTTKETLRSTRNEYQQAYLEHDMGEFVDSEQSDIEPTVSEGDPIEEAKTMQSIPNRKNLKTLSTRMMEEIGKRDD